VRGADPERDLRHGAAPASGPGPRGRSARTGPRTAPRCARSR
jgi:hypothetical protein